MQAKPIDSLTSPAAKKYQAMKNRLFLFNLIAEFLFLISFSCYRLVAPAENFPFALPG